MRDLSFYRLLIDYKNGWQPSSVDESADLERAYYAAARAKGATIAEIKNKYATSQNEDRSVYIDRIQHAANDR